jgi:sialic acid synthase SpsE
MSAAAMTYVIAEAGSCGDGNLTKMLSLIDDAKAVKADAVKFQWTSDARAMALGRGSAKRDGYESIYRHYLEWPQKWHAELASHCESVGIDYLCTVYLADDIKAVSEYVKGFKVASFEAQDFEFIRAHAYCASLDRPLFISTGMCSKREINRLWREAVLPHGLKNCVKLLHCVSAYPAPFNELNLRVLRPRRYGLWKFAGFSDHSLPALTHSGALAVVAGAEIIEAHLRSADTSPDNPDHDHAMTTDQFLAYVAQIRMVEKALGTGKKERQTCEAVMTQYRVVP